MIKSELTRDFLWRIAYTVAKQGTSFTLTLISAKILDISSFGILNYSLSIIFLLVMFSDFGISTATSKYIAQHNSVLGKEGINNVISNILLTLLLFVLILLGLIFLGSSYFEKNYLYILFLSPLIFLIPATSVYDGVCRGLKKFKDTALIVVIASILSIIIAFPLILNYKILGVIFAYNLLYLSYVLSFMFYFKKPKFKLDKKLIKEILQYSLVYGIAVVSYHIFARTDVLFLGHYGYMDEIAHYSLLNKILSVFLIPFTLLGQVLAPRMTSQYFVKKDTLNIYSFLKKTSLYTAIAGVIIGIISFFILPILFTIYFPQYRSPIFDTLLIPCILICVLSISAAVVDHGIIIPTGFATLMTPIYFVLSIFNIVLNLFLIPKMGYMGAIYSTLICTFLMVLILRFIFFCKLRQKIQDEIKSK